jgi:hypothetical protein
MPSCTFVSSAYRRDHRAGRTPPRAVEEASGPPPDVPTTGLQMLFDESQGTAVGPQFFDTADDMQLGDQGVWSDGPLRDTWQTPSVDMCELKLERRVSG